MDCQHLEEYYELCLLGIDRRGACVELREHIGRGCPTCLARLREAALIVYLLSHPAKKARPNPKLKSRILRRLRRK